MVGGRGGEGETGGTGGRGEEGDGESCRLDRTNVKPNIYSIDCLTAICW